MPVLAFSMSQQIADAAATDVMLFVCRLFCKEICSKQFLISENKNSVSCRESLRTCSVAAENVQDSAELKMTFSLLKNFNVQ